MYMLRNFLWHSSSKWSRINWVIMDFWKIDLIYIIIIAVWLCEWLIVFEYLCGEYCTIFLIFPLKITCLLVVAIVYWIYLWGVAGWRRAQNGKYTRNERQLWVKGYAAFWIIEFVTVFSFILIFAWLSWGPRVLIPRSFLAPRRGLIIEFIIYSYLIFFTYIAKFNMRWNLWNFQLIIALFAVIILSYLLWRDIIILVTRDSMVLGYSARWRTINLTGLVYALSHEWWIIHSLGNRTSNFKYGNLNTNFLLKKHSFRHITPLMEYELNLWFNRFYKDYRLESMYLSCAHLFNLETYYSDFNVLGGQSYFYPRRVGFIPKRLAIWEFLVILKMWHQLIILIWWLLYLFRIKSFKIGSYQLLSVCQFNIYCCYIFGLLIYILCYFILYEIAFRHRPNIFSIIRIMIFCKKSVEYYSGVLWNIEEFSINNELFNVFIQIIDKFL